MSETVAKQPKSDRQVKIDAIRKKQKGAESRRGYAIVGVSVLIALVIIGAAAYTPVKNWWDLRGVKSEPLSAIGAPASVCGEITTEKADGNQEHVPEGTPVPYETAPPAFGPHYDAPDSIERRVYVAEDRPDLRVLVHNLEHGYTVLWYDETAAADADTMTDIRAIATKFAENDNLRNKFKAVPWTSADAEEQAGDFPDGQHIALTHWSAGGVGESDTTKQVGVWQYCSEPSGEALDAFMKDYPYLDSPEPNGM